MNIDKSQLVTGEIADYFLDRSSGILYSYSKNIRRTVTNISGNIRLVKEITGGRPVPLLIHLCNSPVPDRETRRYSATQLPHVYKAMAMVSEPGLSSLIMSLLFRFRKPPIPMRAFTDEDKARAWLLQFC